ncbi:MAG: DNA replication and repair protein RecF, partial [Bacteroidales bacterium]|nr:DNA replication and repair protein RecF [Bacteroidales bacterium]
MSLFLKNISVVNFKSFEEQSLEFCDNINCIIGDNGVGKTNIMDAIYHLSMCKSFFTQQDRLCIKHGEDFYVVQGDYDIDGKNEKIYCGLHREEKHKSFRRNGAEYQRLSDHVGLIPIIFSSPTDTNLIFDSDSRRKFVDSIISQFDKIYLKNLNSYKRALEHRNALLFKIQGGEYHSDAEFEIWDMQLCDFGTKIHEVRKKFISEIIPIFQKYYSLISAGKETVRLVYESKLDEMPFEEILASNKSRDCASGHTTSGIHRDDYAFMLNDDNIRICGSQGQQKTYIVCLKFAQFDYIFNKIGVKPILLLDDIFDKLDPKRVKVISQLVSSDEFGQIFITDTNSERLDKII